jgi:hypothetical protein
MTKKNGGQAFPSVEYFDGNPSYTKDGMTLRDWFAGQALIGEMRESGDDMDWLPRAELMAARCYKVADAMIKEREK